MKYAFLSLLLLNILYALWQLQVRTPETAEVPVAMVAPVTAQQSPQSPQPRAAPVAPPAQASALCVTLGSFADATEAGQLRQRLLALGIDAVVDPREVVAGTDFWLVMPVVGGERHAVLQLSALQEQGFDSFLITRGEMAGQLSLGVFTREDHAQLRREQLQRLGHEVNVHALSKKEQQFVVEVGNDGRRLLDQAMLSRLRKDFPFMQHQYKRCAGVANGAGIP